MPVETRYYDVSDDTYFVLEKTDNGGAALVGRDYADHTFSISLSPKDVDHLIKELEKYQSPKPDVKIPTYSITPDQNTTIRT
jgi:hypothetical protein